MAYNSITLIPPAFKPHCRGLMRLSLSNNKLKEFNQEVAKTLVDLVDLDISFNFLSQYPYEEGSLPNLINLDIRGNSILSIPKFVLNSKLKCLYLEWEHVVKEEKYLKTTNDQEQHPSIETYNRDSFLIPIEKLREAFAMYPFITSGFLVRQ